ncbi:hypothetical protein [Streptomyces sp. VRA16 Mangrove soil]|uniref:hypothetical protein n=1 Tax=Streptomyces sp. VRA16 Mangrove soil TaxID=2817434 RepID=UPI001A9D00C9|nr:hypothetical protein [Streptomyces sp. VRA16 Mangrove soil]MBO1330242.1 hypothetical protein [Streptomyces sp. VRA16 Mangrove soil]
MTPRTPRADAPPGHPERATERLLREALAARADSITVRTLRPARPPVPQPRRLPWPPRGWRRYALPLVGLATAVIAAMVVGHLLMGPDRDRRPVPPAAPPSPTGSRLPATPSPSLPPSGTATPSSVVPSPSSPPTNTGDNSATPSRGTSSP